MIVTEGTVNDDEMDWQALYQAERRADRTAARVFVDACRSGNGAALLDAADFINGTSIEGWRLAMKGVGRLIGVDDAIRDAFLPIWIESKTLARRVGDKRALAAALRVLLPGSYRGPALRLFRGAQGNEQRCRLYGFSWTTDFQTARDFAKERQRSPSGGIVLETVAPPEAVLLARKPEAYYDEFEVVVDPYKLGKATVRERLPGFAHLKVNG